MFRTIAVTLLGCACVLAGCGSKSRPTEIIVHQHSPQRTRVTVDTSQVPRDWLIGTERRESEMFGHSDSKEIVRLRPARRFKVIIVPDEPTDQRSSQ